MTTEAEAHRVVRPSSDEDRRTARVLLARLLVEQAEYLGHPVERQIQVDADTVLPDEARAARS